MTKKKRKYTHKKVKIIPIEHGSILDEIDHEFSPGAGGYKTRRKKKSRF